MEEKWVLQSLTAWGVLMTTLTGVLPAINAVLPFVESRVNGCVGTACTWSIEPSMLTTVNTSVTTILTALGSLVGIILVIWGRFNAARHPTKLTLFKPQNGSKGLAA